MYLGHGNRFVGGHQHTTGNRCWCGFLAVPARFHERDGKGRVIGELGEGRYLAWLASDEKPDYVNPPVMEEIRGKELSRPEKPSAEGSGNPEGEAGARQEGETPSLKTCNTCNKPFTNRGNVCNACRQAAYRERKAT